MNKTKNKAEYYYSPRFGHFNIYHREANGSGRYIDSAITQEEAKRKVYELNGWDYKPKSNPKQ